MIYKWILRCWGTLAVLAHLHVYKMTTMRERYLFWLQTLKLDSSSCQHVTAWDSEKWRTSSELYQLYLLATLDNRQARCSKATAFAMNCHLSDEGSRKGLNPCNATRALLTEGNVIHIGAAALLPF